MAFIGNTNTTQGFIPAIDYFSGNGSTVAFTLSRPVASVAQVQANISNVPQNPSSAFSVSGNTITFTSAPPSGTNNIYVYYTSPITQVIAPSQGTVSPTSLSTGGPYWDASGNVGIGTTSPTYQTQIYGTGQTTAALTDAGNKGGSLLLNTPTVNAGDGGALLIGAGGSGAKPFAAIKGLLADGASNTTGNLAFSTRNATGDTALTERMRIDSSGNVGIGTSSPTSKLSVANGSSGGFEVNPDGTGSGPALIAYNRNTSAYLQMTSTALFHVWQTSGTERMRIDSSGNLLVGLTTKTVSASSICEMSGAIGIGIRSTGGDTAPAGFFWNNATTGNNVFLQFATEAGGTVRGSITYNRGGGLTAYNVTSDYRSKTVNGPVENALAKVAALKPCTGRMNDAEYDIDFFVAHELQEVVPSAVTGDKDAVNEDGSPNYQMVDKSALIPLLTAAIQEQQALITTLTDRITALEAK